jgi:hypothetical protein
MKTTLIFVLGFILGICVTGVVAAAGTEIIGGDGYLFGVTVTDGSDGSAICGTPYYYADTKKIECNE